MSRVFLSNVDDYLGPSQACVNPLFSTDKEKPSAAAAATTSATTADDSQNGSASTTAAAGKVIPRQQRRRRVQNISQGGEGGPSIFPPPQPAAAAAPSSSSSSSIVKATIADCLACSGCVTTAETVLLEEQHSLQALQEIIHKPAQERPMLVLTISPASWADLLRHNNLPNNNTVNLLDRQRQLTSLFQQTLNVSVVLDGNLPLQWALQESAQEFCRAWRHKHSNITSHSDNDDIMTMQIDPNRQEILQQQLTPSRALSSTRTEYVLTDQNNTTEIVTIEESSDECQRTQQALPVVASSCPAVVCLVEKSFHRAVPHLATTKSPMSLAGAWWKQQQQQSRSNTIFHVAVMPCYDKKLEALRKDFVSDATGEKDVDMVITTHECLELVQQALKVQGIVPSTTSSLPISQQPLAPVYSSVSEWVSSSVSGMVKNQCCLIASPQQQVGFNKVLQSSSLDHTFFASGSGGYAAYIFCYAAKELFGVSLTLQDLIWTRVSAAMAGGISEQRVSARVASQQRRREYYEIALYRDMNNGTFSLTNNVSSSSVLPVLRFAVAYGMQTIQRALQPFADESNISGSSSSPSHPFDYMEVMACPSGCLNGGGQIRLAERETPTETRQRVAATQALFQAPSSSSSSTNNDDVIPVQNLHTRYHVVPPMQYAQGAVAGVAVKDMQF